MRPLCEICGRPALYHETSIQESGVYHRHLCGYHGRRVWHEAIPEYVSDEAQAWEMLEQVVADPAELERAQAFIRRLRRSRPTRREE